MAKKKTNTLLIAGGIAAAAAAGWYFFLRPKPVTSTTPAKFAVTAQRIQTPGSGIMTAPPPPTENNTGTLNGLQNLAGSALDLGRSLFGSQTVEPRDLDFELE